MNIRQIEYVLAVGELGNFGKAANKCFTTQSTLSTMIARLEEELAITIFNRKTKPVTVTQEGKHVIQQLSVIAKEIENLQEVVQAMKGETGGTVKIGVIPTVAPYLLPLFLSDFTNKVPKIHFVVSEMTTERMITLINKRQLDIGIASTPLHQPFLTEMPIYNEPFLLYDKSNNQPTTNFKLTDIDFDRLWLLEEGHCMRTQVKNICNLRRSRSRYNNLDYQSGTIDTLMKFVGSNNGITFLPYLATLNLSEKERLHLKTLQKPVPVRTISLITHNHFVKKGLLDALKSAITKVVNPLLPVEEEQQIIHPN